MKVSKTTTYGELQHAFNSEYPYLKIEFFKSTHAPAKISVSKQQMKNITAVKVALGNDVQIDISAHRTVLEFEQEFQTKLGVGLQVFRRSGNLWIETSLTDKWTLGQQNTEGKLMSTDLDDKPEITDYHEQD